MEMVMNIFVGTSGYNYKEWKGNFYPEDLSDKKMLHYYSEHFNTVEINNTFYRMPKKQVLENWMTQVPKNFKFIIKAPKRITHIKKLEADDSAEYFIKTAASLKDQLGVLLFQLPPYLKKDIDKFNTFLKTIPENIKAAFEFRNKSWLDDEVFNILKEHNSALCLTDTDEDPVNELIPTAGWIYLRLRKTDYKNAAIKKWKKMILSGSWNEAYVLFKHEDEGKGPEFAEKFLKVSANQKS
jgi:uncharacterized protein YecE (DUF72 family)